MKSACDMPTSSSASASSRMPRGPLPKCAARTTRVARRCDGVQACQGNHSLGVGGARRERANQAVPDRLFLSEDPATGGREPFEDLSPNSLEVIAGAKVEPALASAVPGARFQFERQGYFCVDPDSKRGQPVFNRTVTLKDSWAKIQKRA